MYKVNYLDSVLKEDIPKISKKEKRRIKLNIEERLVKNPILLGHTLRYSLKGLRKFRVGDYRIIYQIKNKEILIVKIGHRKDVYKDFKTV